MVNAAVALSPSASDWLLLATCVRRAIRFPTCGLGGTSPSWLLPLPLTLRAVLLARRIRGDPRASLLLSGAAFALSSFSFSLSAGPLFRFLLWLSFSLLLSLSLTTPELLLLASLLNRRFASLGDHVAGTTGGFGRPRAGLTLTAFCFALSSLPGDDDERGGVGGESVRVATAARLGVGLGGEP